MSPPRILITDDHPEIITIVKQQMNNIASIVGSAHDLHGTRDSGMVHTGDI